MSAHTKIEWADSTFNPWMGCTKVSPACDNCYAAVSTPVRTKGIQWGQGKPRQRTSAANWNLPVRWNEQKFVECIECGWRGELRSVERPAGQNPICPSCSEQAPMRISRRRVFCASLADWLDNEVDIEWFADLLDLIRRTPNLDWLLLTKRIGNWSARMVEAQILAEDDPTGSELCEWITAWINGRPPANVWIGATVVNQEEADRDIPKLLQVPARIRFLSIEPMLGAIDLSSAWHGESALIADCWGDCAWCSNGHPPLHNCQSGRQSDSEYNKGRSGLDWVICGGESGPNARPLHPDWISGLRDQCDEDGVAFLFKQWGEYRPSSQCPQDCPIEPTAVHISGRVENLPQDAFRHLSLRDPEWVGMCRVGKKVAGNLLDGRQHLEWPT